MSRYHEPTVTRPRVPFTPNIADGAGRRTDVPIEVTMYPETVTEAVAFLASQGYVDDYQLCPDGILDTRGHRTHPADTATVDYTFRFEGPSDPGDSAIVLGVHCAEWARKGVIVSAYGADIEPETAAMLTALSRPPEDRDAG